MSNEDEKRQASSRHHLHALSRAGTASLARRGMQDLIAEEEGKTEQWCEQGRIFQRQEQYVEAVECFRRGLQFDPNHEYLQFLMGSAYYQASVITQNRPMSDHLKTGQRKASGTLFRGGFSLRRHGQCLERREETTSFSFGTAGLVAAAHRASDPVRRETASTI